ncbi:hypothetical protein [Nitritalea halalkaliphila]|uniref:hypothetical protein n=1 Tax=Nitritalea halalkaliphila TaxID=590849 RepID=UPI0003067C87
MGDFRFDFAFMEFGVGYNLISRERFTVSTTLAYLRTNQVRHFKDGIAGNIVNFALNRVPNHGARVGLQTAFKLNDAISLVPELGFSPRIDRFQSFWTSLGLTYSF